MKNEAVRNHNVYKVGRERRVLKENQGQRDRWETRREEYHRSQGQKGFKKKESPQF